MFEFFKKERFVEAGDIEALGFPTVTGEELLESSLIILYPEFGEKIGNLKKGELTQLIVDAKLTEKELKIIIDGAVVDGSNQKITSWTPEEMEVKETLSKFLS